MLFAQTLVKMSLANRTRGPHQQPLSRHNVTKVHGREWARLGEDVKSRLNTVASQWRVCKEQELRDAVEGDRTALELALNREKQEEEEELSMQLSSARLDSHALQGWTRILQSDVWSSSTLSSMRAKSVRPPEAISNDQFDAWAASSPLSITVSEPIVPLAAAICRARGNLKNAVLIIEEEDQEHAYMVVMAMLQPMSLFLLPLHDLDIPPLDHRVALRAEWDTMASTDFTHFWGYDHEGYASADILEGVDIDKVAIVPICSHKSTRIVVSMDLAVPLGNWLSAQDAMSIQQSRSSDRREAAAASSRAAPAATPAWVSHLFQHPSTSSPAISTVPVPSGSEAQPGDMIEEEGGAENTALHVAFEDAIAELQHRKADMKDAGLHQDGMFKKTLLGGKWQVARTGRTLYGLRVDVVKGSGSLHSMCLKFKLPASASFEYNVYGESLAADLVAIWEMRMSALHAYWESHDCPETWPKDPIPPLELGTELQQRCESLKGRPAKRLQAIVSLCPS